MREVIQWYNLQVSEGSNVAEYLDIHIVMDDPRKKQKGEYPINFLRNTGTHIIHSSLLDLTLLHSDGLNFGSLDLGC
jgi:hypothetical protein